MICKIKHISDENHNWLNYCIVTCVIPDNKIEKYISFNSSSWLAVYIGKHVRATTNFYDRADHLHKVHWDHQNFGTISSIDIISGIDIFRHRKEDNK